MCGRFTTTAPADVLAEEFGLTSIAADYTPRFNLAPTQQVPVVAEPGKLELYRWGLVPSWSDGLAGGTRMINARSETVHRKRSFREAFAHRRCLVLGDGFYEWKRSGRAKLPSYVRQVSRRPWAFAGLWDSWQSPEGEQVRTCAILTTEANELLASVHHRMPVILPKAARVQWLDPGTSEAALRALLVAPPTEGLEMFSVSSRVNSPRWDGPQCVEPELPGGTLPLFPDL